MSCILQVNLELLKMVMMNKVLIMCDCWYNWIMIWYCQHIMSQLGFFNKISVFPSPVGDMWVYLWHSIKITINCDQEKNRSSCRNSISLKLLCQLEIAQSSKKKLSFSEMTITKGKSLTFLVKVSFSAVPYSLGNKSIFGSEYYWWRIWIGEHWLTTFLDNWRFTSVFRNYAI